MPDLRRIMSRIARFDTGIAAVAAASAECRAAVCHTAPGKPRSPSDRPHGPARVDRDPRSPLIALTSLLAGLIPVSLRQRSLTRNVAVNWLTAMLNAVLALVMTPIVVRSLAQEGYGVWTFLNGLMLYSNLLYVGLGGAVMRGLSEAVGRNDVAAQRRLVGLAVTIYAGLGLVCLAIALAVGPFVPQMFATSLHPEIEQSTAGAAAFLGLRLALMFVGSALSALLAAHGRFDLVGLTTVAAVVPRLLLVLWATRQPSPLVPLAMVTVTDAALLVPAFYALCRVVAPAVHIRPALPTIAELRTLYGFGIQVFVVQVAAVIISYTDTALIGILLGAVSVGLYSLPLQLIEQSRLLVNGVTQNLIPELSALKARGEMAQLARLFLAASRACATMSAFVNVHFVLLGPAFLTLWVGPTMATDSPPILLFLAIAATAAAVSTQVMTPFYMALDRVRILVVIVVAEAGLNFVLSYWLAQTIGLWGVALGTAIPAVGLTLVFAPRPILAELGLGVDRFAAHVIGPVVLLVAASVGVQTVISRWFAIHSYVDLALRVAASAVVTLPIVLTTFERHELPGPLRRFSLRRGVPAG